MIDQERLCDGDYQALADLRYSIRRFRQFSAKEADKLGLTPHQHQALLAIKGLPIGKEMTARMLAERLLIARKLVDSLIRELVGGGYVEVGSSTTGRGRNGIRLTRKADDILDRLASAHLFEIRKMAPELMQALRVLQDRQKMQQTAWML